MRPPPTIWDVWREVGGALLELWHRWCRRQ